MDAANYGPATGSGVVLDSGVVVLKDRRSSSDAEWLARLDRLGAREGFFAKLGEDHAALFVRRKDTLIVTFETSEAVMRRELDQMPFGMTVSDMRDCSHLCLIARRDTWYRAPEIYQFFDSLVDEAFFEDFERVVFFGAGMAGYAAAAFSVAAPGATVLLVQPQATLDPTLAGWDTRFTEYRRLNFTDRYGFAPDMTDGARQVYVIFDPEQTYDAMHASLFNKPFTRMLPCRNMGSDLFGALSKMQVLQCALAGCASGTFDEHLFWTYYRARRNYIPYLRKLLSKLETDGRPILGEMVARNAGERLNDQKFRARASEMAAEVAYIREKLGLRPGPKKP